MRWLVVLAACGGSAPPPATPAIAPVPEFVEAKPVVEETPVESKPVNADEAKQAAAAFLEQVRSSTGAITGCYNAAQSANPELRSKEIQLSITAAFDASGMVKLSLQPMVTESFADCVNKLASQWKIQLTQPMTFKASLTLKP
jgi:hypothetical protein